MNPAHVLVAAALALTTLALHGTSVSIADNHFGPRKVRVGAGAAVTWKWRGSRRHDVYFISGPAKIRSCAAQRHGTCKRRFPRPGTYDYVCTFHGSMAGRVTVVRGR
jgi:plastocyanin